MRPNIGKTTIKTTDKFKDNDKLRTMGTIGNSVFKNLARRVMFFCRPGWLALALVVAGFAYLCFTVLAPWQLGKNTQTSRENQQIAAARNAAEIPVTTLLPQQDSAAPDAQWRRVSATGHYLPAAQVVARLRVVEGKPAFHVLVPFAVNDGPTVLVDRGYIRPVQGTTAPPIPALPTAAVTISARLRDSETAPANRTPVHADGVMQVYAIDTTQIATATGIALTGSYLQLVEDQPGVLGVPELPRLDAGPFLSYGIQWIVFGIAAPLGLGYFVVSEIRARRRHTTAAELSDTCEPVTVEDKLTDRYGRRH